MKALTVMMALLVFLAACVTGPAAPKGKYSAYCKTHATEVTLDESPDVEAAFRDCMHLEGVHEIEVSKSK